MRNPFLPNEYLSLIRCRVWLCVGAGVVVFVFLGCASRPHQYQPPDSTRMDEARNRLSVSVDKATASAKKIREHILNAKISTEKIVKFSGTIEVKLHQLHARVTAELRPEVESIQADVASEKAEQAVLTDQLSQAIARQKTLEGELNQAQTDKTELTKESQAYAAEAQVLADKATKENTAKIKAEKALSWYRWHSWIIKIVTTLIVILIVGLAFLWFTGRLALKTL